MNIPVEITYRDVEKTDELETLIHEKAAKLDRLASGLSGCRVSVEKEQKHRHTGNPYRVGIDVTLPPGHEVPVEEKPRPDDVNVTLSTMVIRAFHTAERRIKEAVEKRRGEVKKHPHQEPHGFVTKLFPEEGYGFIKTLERGEIYFHRNSVVNGEFDRMRRGTGVRYVVAEGEKGLQASTVKVVQK